MLSGARRLPRLDCALAQRRHYLTVLLNGGDGAKPIALKLSVPWGKVPLAKPFEEVASPPILRVLSASASSLNNKSRAIITLADETAVTAAVELLPKPIEAGCHDDEGEEEQAVDTSDEEDEWDDFYPEVEESSGHVLLDLVYQGGGTEEDATEEAVEEVVASSEALPDCKGLPSPSFVIDLCLWPHDLFGVATIHTDEQGKRNWQSSWSFNVDADSINEGMSDSLQVQGTWASFTHRDQPLEYRGVICGSILEKFKISLDTHYKEKEVLGSGAEGEVFRAESIDNSHSCAVKWSVYGKLIIEEPREPLIMKRLCHPNVRRLFCAWKEERRTLFIAHELCKCTLENYLDEEFVAPISDRIKIFTEVVSGVSYLHEQGIVHRDVKCNNIFLDDHGSAKIGDFGQSGFIASRSCSYGGKRYGTMLYAAPELLRMQRHGLKSDIFSLGMVYAELFEPSNGAAERREWLIKLKELTKSRQWRRNPLSSWKKSELSNGWTGDEYLLTKMLESSPEERPSCTDILEVLTQATLKA